MKCLAFLLAAGLLVPALAGCIASEREPADVVTTIYPVTFLAQELAGHDLVVRSLLGTGQEPHSWEPSVRDVQDIAAARILAVQGAGMEPWLDDLLANLGRDAPPVVVTSAALHFIAGAEDHHEHGDEVDEHEEDADDHAPAPAGVDPHTWLDPVLFAEQARVLAASMQRHFPEDAEGIGDRLDALVQELDLLHQEYTAGLLDCTSRFIIVNHNAFAYLARQYNFTVEAVHGLSPGGEPSPATVRRLVDLAREHNVTVVFFEDLASPRTVQAIADEADIEARVLHPIGGLTREQAATGEDYRSLMRTNLNALAEAMQCL